MQRVCAVEVVRAAEAAAPVPEPVLMQRASAALATTCLELLTGGPATGPDGRGRGGRATGSRVVGLVGSGNNGGDALWALARLAARGVRASAIGSVDRMHPGGAASARAAGVTLLDWSDPRTTRTLADAQLALDGIVGIGGSGGLRERAATAVALLAERGVPVVAVDLPSGVDADTGEVGEPAVRALVTVCFGVLKPGLLLPGGRAHAGHVRVVDIGLREAELRPAAWTLSTADLAAAARDDDAHKYRQGLVEVVAGSRAYPGAAVLAVGGALRSGAGMVAHRGAVAGAGLGGEDRAASMVVAAHPEVVLDTGRRPDARCIGPGLGDRALPGMIRAALDDEVALVLDASALGVLAGRAAGREALQRRGARGLVSVLTPHAGEFAVLGFDLAGGPLVAARRAADELQSVIVLKGPGTVVAAPGGPAYIDTFGSPALASAGTGDVLAGLIAGMLAVAARSEVLDQDRAALVAARAVGLHGLAGRLASVGGSTIIASDLVAALPEAQRTAVRAASQEPS